MPRAARARRTVGLTLLEFVVALGIVAVLVTLALPSFGGVMARHRLKAAAQHLSMDLAELRLDATQRGTALHLHFDPGENWCYTVATVSGCGCQVAQSCQLKTVHAREHPGVQLIGSQNMLFDPMTLGSVGSGSAVLQIRDGAQLRVALTRLGRPSVCAPGASVPGYPRC